MMQQVDNTNVFVKYLPSEVDDSRLRGLFSPFGTIVSAKVMVEVHTGASLGYGFVRFSAADEAQKAIATMAGCKVDSKTLLCQLSTFPMRSDPSTNIYIKPLRPTFTEDNLVEIFSCFGPIDTVKVMRDKTTGESKRIGFVKFDDQASATAAVEKMNGYKLDQMEPALIVKYAESDSQRISRKAHSPSPASPASTPPQSPHSSPRSYHYSTPAPTPTPTTPVPTPYYHEVAYVPAYPHSYYVPCATSYQWGQYHPHYHTPHTQSFMVVPTSQPYCVYCEGMYM